jgi:hypothetical protein
VEFQRFEAFSAFSLNVGETGHLQRFEVFPVIRGLCGDFYASRLGAFYAPRHKIELFAVFV